MKRLITYAFGNWDDSKRKYDINTSSILTELILEAGKCKVYASDLFIDWMNVQSLTLRQEKATHVYLFGFRDAGVDHYDYLKANFGPGSCNGNPWKYYRCIYRLEVTKRFKHIKLKLYLTYKREEAYRPSRMRVEELATKFKDIALQYLETDEFFDCCNDEGLALTTEEIEWLGLGESEDD